MPNLRRQSRVAAQLAYNPKIQGLRALLAELQGNRDAEIGAAGMQRRGTVQSIRAARPRIMDAYDAEDTTLEATRAAISPVSGQLGAAAQSILQAGNVERGLAQGRVADARRREVVDLEDQRMAAIAGEGHAVSAANSRYAGDSAKVLQQLVGVLGDQGLYASKMLGDLSNARAQRRVQIRGQDVTKRGQDLSHQDRVEDRKARQEAARKNGGRGWITPAAQERIRTTLGEALSTVPDLFEAGATREEVAALLAKGQKDQTKPVYETVEDPNKPGKTITRKKLNPADGTPEVKVIPGLPKIKDPLLVQAAIEQHLDGRISRKTARLLHKNRIKIGPLGLITPEQYERKRRKNRREKPYTPDLNGPL